MDETIEGKKEYGHGFANSKRVAYGTHAEVKAFLSSTYDLSAKKVTRRFAMRNLETLQDGKGLRHISGDYMTGIVYR